jgi:hypothetical protein
MQPPFRKGERNSDLLPCVGTSLLKIFGVAGNPDPPVVVSKVLADSAHSYLVAWLNQHAQGVTEYIIMYRKIPVSTTIQI